jgi:hypothetical protein
MLMLIEAVWTGGRKTRGALGRVEFLCRGEALLGRVELARCKGKHDVAGSRRRRKGRQTLGWAGEQKH